MSYSANDNQNYFVTSGRTTSRVVAQPGGQCSISLGGWTPEELERQRLLREQREKGVTEEETPAPEEKVEKPTIATVGKENNDVKNEPEETVNKPSAPPVVMPAGVSSNAFASSASTNSFNVITDRPTSRVSRPPGGHCSIVLG
eukprot:CAMPEP_0176085398 /NCGR_PEP_ID=MMETSP0120_2-20121206/42740_1 /TAXON_ID=160619 /ORGANISM="Kryptoperidinium foliaceum, Strain CCMP 1326" /LENGTH=143 /DNA_ID=CAMNT_0017419213 /DNA_START=40 /DNA_END=471 /DNA_ORIENTATION=+